MTHQPPPDPLSVQVTGREIYDAVLQLTGRVDVLIQRVTETQADVRDHEERIRALESGRWPLPALAAALALASLGVAIIPKLAN